MSDHQPTTEQMREWFAEPRTQAEALSPDAHYEAEEMFDRWLAEVERRAAEKAYNAGHRAAIRWKRGTLSHNPYRRNEGERGAD